MLHPPFDVMKKEKTPFKLGLACLQDDREREITPRVPALACGLCQKKKKKEADKQSRKRRILDQLCFHASR